MRLYLFPEARHQPDWRLEIISCLLPQALFIFFLKLLRQATCRATNVGFRSIRLSQRGLFLHHDTEFHRGHSDHLHHSSLEGSDGVIACFGTDGSDTVLGMIPQQL